MLTWFFIGLSTVLALMLSIVAYYLIKFSKIIMVFEDDIGDTIATLNEVEDTMDNVLQMEIFYDSPEIKKEVDKILETVRFSRVNIQKMVERFTARSKQQYYFVENEEPDFPQSQEELQAIPRLPGQPPDTPNPLQMLQNEGIILNVRHRRKE